MEHSFGVRERCAPPQLPLLIWFKWASLTETNMDYPLGNLGPERFQQSCQALPAKEYARVQSFPVAQPDGGRDAVSYYPEGGGDTFMVFQVKYARKPLAETKPHKWLAAIAEDECPPDWRR